MRKSPYDILMVAVDADVVTIRKAYRALAKGLHPDAGGDPGEFSDLNAAHELLMDPKRRAEYDATGLWPRETPEQHPDADILPRIQALLFDTLMGGFDHANGDVIAEMCRRLAKNTEDLKLQIAAGERALLGARKYAKRIWRKDGGDNLLAKLLDSKIDDTERSLAGAQVSITQNARMVAFLKDYGWQRESPIALSLGESMAAMERSLLGHLFNSSVS